MPCAPGGAPAFARSDHSTAACWTAEDTNEIERLVEGFLAGREELFERRVADGRIVDGHGDLICDDIFCLPDGPRVLDCLEFDDRLRYLDGLDDIAFLAMDLEHLGAHELAGLLVDSYAEYAGDPVPPALLQHYLAYRAFVRAKINCLNFAQGDGTARDAARSYAALALRHLRAGQVRLILIGGLPAAGKSTVAGLLADRLGAVLLSSDHIRKEMAGISPLIPATGAYRRGIYDDEHTARTYDELIRRAVELLGVGETVVLDASWTRDRSCGRSPRASATRAHAEFVGVECWAPATVRLARLIARSDDASDADPQVADRMALDAESVARCDPGVDRWRCRGGGGRTAAVLETGASCPTRGTVTRTRRRTPPGTATANTASAKAVC